MRLFLLQIGEEYPPDLRGEICAHLHREVSTIHGSEELSLELNPWGTVLTWNKWSHFFTHSFP
jgi:hypothetical protein